MSAVDPEVANGIFEKAVLGALKDKCVILVTHQLQFIKRCPQIMILEDGKQSMLGTHDELLQKGFDADKIMQSYTESLNKAKVAKEKEENERKEAEQAALFSKAKIDDQERNNRLLRLKQITEEH